MLPLVGCVALAIFSLCVAYSVPSSLASDRGITQIIGSVDQWHCFVPEAHFLDAHVHAGELPMWNPYVRCGAPFAARPHAYMFYPPNFIRSLLTNPVTPMNTHIGLTIVLFLHVLLGAAGTYLLAREHKMSYVAAVTASLVFILSAGMIRRTMSNFFITTIVWMPFIFICINRGFSADTWRVKLRYAVAAGFLFGLSLLSGSPHMTMHLSLSIAVYGVVYRLTSLNREQFASVKRVARTITQDTAFGVLIILIGGLMAAAMMYPTLEYSAFSHRGTAGNEVEETAFPFYDLLTALVSYTGDNNHLEDLRLAGLGVTLIALLGLTNRNWRSVAIYAVLFWVFIDITFGPPRPWAQLLIAISPYQLSSLSRGMMWACFPLAMLAGFGVDAVVTRWFEGKRSIFRTIFIVVIGMMLMLSLDLELDHHLFLDTKWPAIVMPLVLIAFVCMLGFIPRQVSEERRRFTVNTRFNPAILLAAIVMFELYFWAPNYVDYLRDWLGYKGPTETLWAEKAFWNDNHRMYDEAPNLGLLELEPLTNGYDPLYIKRCHDVLFAEERYAAILYGQLLVRGSHRANLFLKRPFWLARQYVEGPLPEASILFPATSTVFLSGVDTDLPIPKVDGDLLPFTAVSLDNLETRPLANREELAKSMESHGDRPLRLTLNIGGIRTEGYHSSCRFVYSSDLPVRVTPTTDDGMDGTPYPGMTIPLEPTGDEYRLFEFPLPDFEETQLELDVYLEKAGADFKLIQAELLIDRSDENALIEIVSRKANSIDLRVTDLPGDRVLTYHDALYPYWHAYVDGKEVPILLANDAFKAIVLPPGSHDIRFEFRPTRVYVGIAISVATVIAILIYALLEWRAARHLIGSA